MRRLFAISAILVAIGGLTLAASALPMLADESPASGALEPSTDGMMPGGEADYGSAETGAEGGPNAAGPDPDGADAGGADSGLAASLLEMVGLLASFGGSDDGGGLDGTDALEDDPGDLPSDMDPEDVDPDDLPDDMDPEDLPSDVDPEDIDPDEFDDDAFQDLDTDDIPDDFESGDQDGALESESSDSAFDSDSETGDDTDSSSMPDSSDQLSGDEASTDESSGGLFDIPLSLGGLGGDLGSLFGGAGGGGDGEEFEDGADSMDPDMDLSDSIDSDSDSSDDSGPSSDDSSAAGDSETSDDTDDLSATEIDDGGSDFADLIPGTDQPLALAAIGLVAVALAYALITRKNPLKLARTIPSILISVVVGTLVALSNVLERAIAALAQLRSIADLPGLVLAAIVGAFASMRSRARSATNSITRRVTGDSSASVAAQGEITETRSAQERIREAFASVVATSSVSRLRVSTPTDVARSAVDSGTPREPVETITDAFRDVEYGDRDPTSRVDRTETARKQLQAALEEPDEDGEAE